MKTQTLYDETSWNTEFLLPRVTDDVELLEIQILLGGLSLLLSRLHPIFGKNRFVSTRNLASRLSRAVEYGNPARAHLLSAELRGTLAECEKTLDPGTLMVLRKLLAKTAKDETDNQDSEGFEYFTYSDFMAEESILTQTSNHGARIHAM
ncbi:MAG TPA: hypothetical protein VLJ57_04495 [Burkholderiaceae bacterium]|nr:hypothetical protein [Burkholderiaceae bacterium]